ncbi:ribokinase [Pedobacter changchengzhani]|uniref:Ribokinase n=1 Tax=Pedobacter changchengzhani TaxID=2529274 RepID=A0A4V3A006_9SPHI|nr:ribokinase [Pedobacter changchengzhani]TDG35353.1 ribokinase [Pedobacter changchengzhani]
MKDETPSVFVLGSFVMGFTIKTKCLPTIGETVIGSNFNLGIGGKGFNQAIAAKRAGANVNILVCTGNDEFGEIAKKTLLNEGISIDNLIALENESSGCGFVTLLTSGENTILIDPGANLKLDVAKVEAVKDAIIKSKILMAQLEIPINSVTYAFEIAKKNNLLTILNPAPAQKLPLALLKNIDILTPNETEAKIILGLDPDADIAIDLLAEKLLNTGVKTIILTRGKHGALIISNNDNKTIAAPKIDAVDSTGAGDCFNGNLVAALLQGKTVEEAVNIAVLAGAYCAQYLGVFDGLPSQKQLIEFKETVQYT